MKFKRTTLLLAVFILLSTGCKSFEPVQDIEADTRFQITEIQQDVDFLYQTVTRVNPLFYDNPELTSTFKDNLEKVKEDLEVPLNRTGIFTSLSPAVSALKDGHTNFNLPIADIYDYLNSGGTLFPLDVLFVEDKIYVYQSYTENAELLPGTQILSVNGVETGEILSGLTAMMSGANPQWRLRRMDGQSDIFKILLWMQYGWEDTFELVLQHNKDRIEITVAGVRIDSIREKRNTSTRPLYDYQLLEAHVGLLTIRTFAGDFKKYRNFLKTTFEQLLKEDVTDLIVDVRDNGGGQIHLAEELLAYFVTEPFNTNIETAVRASKPFKEHAKKRIPKFIRWLPLQYLDSRGRAIWRAEEGELVSVSEKQVKPKRASKRFSGTPYLLINEGSFSTAAVFASAFKRLGVGLLIGRITGGEDGTFYAESMPVHLPNSKLTVNVATMRFVLDEERSGETKSGVEPDIFVKKSITDEINEIDTVLEKAGEYILNR